MKHLLFFITLFFIISCEKEPIDQTQPNAMIDGCGTIEFSSGESYDITCDYELAAHTSDAPEWNFCNIDEGWALPLIHAPNNNTYIGAVLSFYAGRNELGTFQAVIFQEVEFCTVTSAAFANELLEIDSASITIESITSEFISGKADINLIDGRSINILFKKPIYQ